MWRRSSSNTHLLARIAFATVAFWQLGPSEPARAAETTVFDFGRPNDEALVTLRYFGGMTFASPMTTIYGDGRVVMTMQVAGLHQASESAQLPRTYETAIESGELETLLEDASSGGLLEYDEAHLETVRSALGRSLPIVTDAPSIEISLNFAPLVSSAASGVALSTSNRFSISAPRQLSRAFPEIAEYAAAYRLVQRVENLNRRALGRGTVNEPR